MSKLSISNTNSALDHKEVPMSTGHHRWALCYLWNPWIMPVRGTPGTGTTGDCPVGTLWVIEPCAYPVRVGVFSQSSCRAVLCLGALRHAYTLLQCALLDYTHRCASLDFLCRCKRLHAVSPLWDCSGQYFPPVCVVRVGTCIPKDAYYILMEATEKCITLFPLCVLQTILCTIVA